MRAPIEPGNPGWDPDAAANRADKVGAGLRGAGLIVILLAFLFTSQQFLGKTDDPEPGPAAVYVARDLEAAVSKLETGAVVEYGDSAALRKRAQDGSAVDVFVGLRPDTQALLDGGTCTDGVAVTALPAQHAACLVDRDGARESAAAAFVDELTGIAGRDALLQAGFELPPR